MALQRLPTGLTVSAFVAAVSLGLMTMVGAFAPPGPRGVAPLVHAAVGLCVLWSAAAHLVHGYLPGLEARWVKTHPTSATSPSLSHDVLSVLHIAMMATGLPAVIVMLYAAVAETLFRTVYFQYNLPLRVNIWATGLVDLGALAGAVLLGWRRTRSPQLITVIFWILVFAGLWCSFRVPAYRQLGSGDLAYRIPSHWASVFMLTSAALVGAWTVAEGWRLHRRRVTAWPNALSRLATPAPSWPGFHYSAAVVAIVVLILGCLHIVLPLTVVCALVAGASMLALAHREWNENVADAGLALITLGVVSLCMWGMAWPVWSPAVYEEILNRALIGLAIMTGLWHWLVGVWKQQLDHGEAWTTAGRLIRTARRVGFLIGCTAVLVAVQLAFWPRLPFVIEREMTAARWGWGLAANGLLLLALLHSFRGTNRSTLAWLAIFSVAALVTFVLVRAPDSVAAEWWMLYWPLVMVGVAILSLLVRACLSEASAWRALREPLLLAGILVAPLVTIAGAESAPYFVLPPWVPMAAYASLMLVYVLAAVVPGPPTFTVSAGLCGLMGLWHLRQFAGLGILPAGYFFGILFGLFLVFVGFSYQDRARPGTVRALKWLGGGLVVLSLIGGWAATHY